MKATRAILLAAGFLGGVAVALLVLALVLGGEILLLRTRLEEAQTQLQATRTELERARDRQQLAESRQAEHQQQLEALRAELASWRENRTTNPPAATAMRVHVFSQGRYLGSGRLANGERSNAQELTVHLDGPSAGTADRAPTTTATAVTAFSVAHHYPTWPWLWTWGWVVGEPTNNTASSPDNHAVADAPVPPLVAPTPSPASGVATRSTWPGGLRTLKTTGLKAVPRTGQPLPPGPVPGPVSGASVSPPRRVQNTAVTALPGRPVAERPVLRR